MRRIRSRSLSNGNDSKKPAVSVAVNDKVVLLSSRGEIIILVTLDVLPAQFQDVVH